MKSETYLKSISVCVMTLLFYPVFVRAGTWKTVDLPGVIPHGSWITGISGDNLIGYTLDSDVHNFLYNGTSWAPIDIPSAFGSANVLGISGNNIVGYCQTIGSREHGLFYNGSSWTTLDVPDAGIGGATIINGISGNNLVGSIKMPLTTSTVFSTTQIHKFGLPSIR